MVNNYSTASAFTINWGGSSEFQGPKADFTQDSILTCDAGSFTFDGSSSTNYNNLSWNFSSGSDPSSATDTGPHTVNYTAPGFYTATLTATDSTGCHSSKSVVIEIPTTGGPESVTITTVQPTCTTEGSIVITNVEGGNDPYLYSINGLTYNTSSSFTNIESGIYTIYIKDSVGCTFDTTTVIPAAENVNSITIPNCFTPNNDDTNNQWFVKGECIEKFNCVITNRWGNTILIMNDLSSKWDGSVDSKIAEDGVYFYKITYNYYNEAEKIESGFITLIR